MEPQRKTEDYYADLGVGRSASFEEIKAAFRARAKALHPDRNQQRDTRAEFQRVQEAYSVLGNPEQRHRYDLGGRTAAVDPPTAAPNGEMEPGRKPMGRYVPTGVVILALGLGLVGFEFFGESEEQVRETQLAQFRGAVDPNATDKAMQEAVLKYAQEYSGTPPVSDNVEVVGRDGKKYLVSRLNYRRLESIYDRLVAESEVLKKRREDLEARRADLNNESRNLTSANVSARIDFRIKVEAFNSDGAALVREAETHTRGVDDYFREIERAASQVR